MASVDSILRSILRGGEGMRQMDEPKWARESKRRRELFGGIGESVVGAVKAYGNIKQQKSVQASRDLSTISGFEARLGNKVNNYVLSGDIYDESKIPALKDSINGLYDQHSSRFPELISEFSDERDSALGVINNYSTKNKQKDALLSKIEPTQEKIFSIAKVLNETSTANLTPDGRVKFRNQVRDAIQDVVRLDKLVDDPYYARIDGWADTIEDVKYGISGSAKQLITQINTWQSATEGDPSSMYVITNNELGEMERAIFEGDLSGISPLTERAETDKTSRTTQYEKDYNAYLKNYATISSFSDTQQYKKLKADKEKAYTKLDKQGKKNADSDPMYWFQYPEMEIPGMPEEGVNLQNIDAQKILIKTKAEDIDANYRNEHIAGSSIAEVLNKPLPWAKRKKSLEDKKKEFEGDIGETPTVGQKVIDQLVAEGKVFGEPDIGETVALTEEERVRERMGEGATTKPPPIDYSGETVERNNPGNLRFANQTYATGKDEQGFAVFETAKHGWQALYNQIDKDKTRDLTLEKFINKYAPPSENDTTSYLRNVQQQLKVAPNTNINDINTKKLATAIAKQEGYAGEPPVEKKVKGVRQLTKVQDGKTVVNYDVANTSSFKSQQVGLNKTASDKFSSLSKDERKKHGNLRNFMKAKYTEWLNKTGKYGKGAWYSEGDFKYFFPTKVSPKGTVTNVSGADVYDLFDRRLNMHPAFKGVARGAKATTSPSYENFAKDFDEFREFLQES